MKIQRYPPAGTSFELATTYASYCQLPLLGLSTPHRNQFQEKSGKTATRAVEGKVTCPATDFPACFLSMPLPTEPYIQQLSRWPQDGRVILAQFDADSIIVYQAYRPAIGHFAAQHGYFGGPFKLTRMTWIKPNFLWMMYRSGWATKVGQEVVLAIRLRRSAFDQILALAIPSSFDGERYASREDWQKSVAGSDVRLQWDPDHDPQGKKRPRRAIQLGLRGDVIEKYAREWVIEIQDISDFVAEQRVHALSGDYHQLLTPIEHIYPIENAEVATKLGVANLS